MKSYFSPENLNHLFAINGHYFNQWLLRTYLWVFHNLCIDFSIHVSGWVLNSRRTSYSVSHRKLRDWSVIEFFSLLKGLKVWFLCNQNLNLILMALYDRSSRLSDDEFKLILSLVLWRRL